MAGCFNCISPRVCFLEDNEEVGWCERCSQCPNCSKPFYVRVSWTVGCEGNPTRLRKDVCETCEKTTPDDEECPCSQTARMKTIKYYVWLNDKKI